MLLWAWHCAHIPRAAHSPRIGVAHRSQERDTHSPQCRHFFAWAPMSASQKGHGTVSGKEGCSSTIETCSSTLSLGGAWLWPATVIPNARLPGDTSMTAPPAPARRSPSQWSRSRSPPCGTSSAPPTRRQTGRELRCIVLRMPSPRLAGDRPYVKRYLTPGNCDQGGNSPFFAMTKWEFLLSVWTEPNRRWQRKRLWSRRSPLHPTRSNHKNDDWVPAHFGGGGRPPA